MGKLSKTINKLKNMRNTSDSFILSEDSALESICKILDYYDIPMERLEQTEAAEQAGETLIDALVKLFRRGQLEVSENDKNEMIIIQTTQSGAKIEYQEIKAKHKRMMDKADQKEQYKRMYNFLGSLSGLGSDGIEQLKTGGKWNDLACAEILGSLFLLI